VAKRPVVGLRPGQPGYPARLAGLGSLAPGSDAPGSDAPGSDADEHGCLWLRGDAAALAVRPAVTVVGARAASRGGEVLAQQLAAALGAQGALVVSGGALGIDAAAHRGALQAAGRTCAVLGCGVDVAYPQRHAGLFAEVAERGVLLSMFAPGEPPRRWQFPARNQLMAALADLVVVIEAGADSGSLITAAYARRLGRPVAAFGGSPGTEAAIAAGARRVGSIAEVLAFLAECAGTPAEAGACAAPAPPAPSFLCAGEPEPGAEAAEVARVWAALAAPGAALSPIDLGELCAKTGLLPGDCAAALIDLELRGRCTRLAGGRYIVHAPLS
jgi:DNA processing protein